MTRLMLVTGSLAHGGAERQTVTLANRLAERGYECGLAHVKSDAQLREQVRLPEERVHSLGAKRYFDPGAIQRFAAILARTRPALVVAANAYALLYASLALRASRWRARLAVTFHSTRLLGAKEQLQMALYRPLFWSADCAVFVCDAQRRHWLRRALLARRNEVIYNGVDVEEFRDPGNPAARAVSRYALGYEASDYVVGIAAVLRPEKNHLQLVDAIAALRATGIPARALMIGDGPMRAAVEASARRLGIADSILVTGMQADVRPFITACDVVTLCSVTEALPLAAIEAMAMSRPLVLSDVGGAKEIVVSGRNGFLFPVGDTAAFVARLAALARTSTAAAMGRAARETADARFSERSMLAGYERLLFELCGGRPRAREALSA